MQPHAEAIPTPFVLQPCFHQALPTRPLPCKRGTDSDHPLHLVAEFQTRLDSQGSAPIVWPTRIAVLDQQLVSNPHLPPSPKSEYLF